MIDPEGLLFYNSLEDFSGLSGTKKVNYHSFYNNERAVRIDFHSLKFDGTENRIPFCVVSC